MSGGLGPSIRVSVLRLSSEASGIFDLEDALKNPCSFNFNNQRMVGKVYNTCLTIY